MEDVANGGLQCRQRLGLGGDVPLCNSYGLYDVGYEGGFDFNQNLGSDGANGYNTPATQGFSGGTPTVGATANLDPRSVPLAVATLDQFYSAGGTLPIVFQSSGNLNSWAVAVPTYFNWDTPKLQAAAAVEQSLPPTGALPVNWSSHWFGVPVGNPGNLQMYGTVLQNGPLTYVNGSGGSVGWGASNCLSAVMNVPAATAGNPTTVSAELVSTLVGGNGPRDRSDFGRHGQRRRLRPTTSRCWSIISVSSSPTSGDVIMQETVGGTGVSVKVGGVAVPTPYMRKLRRACY